MKASGEKEANDSQREGKEERRLQAVLALLSGAPVACVCQQFDICRSDLFKFRRRALAAMREAMCDRKRSTDSPPNRLAPDNEEQIKRVCTRQPTLSSYQVQRKLNDEAIKPRTIQRVRKRLRLPRLPKRREPDFRAHRFTGEENLLVREYAKAKHFLGAQRLAWDIQNLHGLPISASTLKRVKQAIERETNPPPAPIIWRRYERRHPHSLWHGDLMEKVTLTDEDRTAFQLTLQDDYSRAYVFCDLFREVNLETTIRALISAMRAFRTIPKAVVFDNGSFFKGKLLIAFCRNLGIRLIHSSVGHPQTNGKLERAFRDDMCEFYKQKPRWIFDELRRDLPAYVHYRNHVRGHYALGGKPAVTRIREQDFFALPSLLERLETFARVEQEPQHTGLNCCFRVLGRNGYVSGIGSGVRINLTETLDGLEARNEDGARFLLKEYRKWKQIRNSWRGRQELPPSFEFEPMQASAVLSDYNVYSGSR